MYNLKKISIIAVMVGSWGFTGNVSACLAAEEINADLRALYQKYQTIDAGQNADYIPELAKVNPKLFSIAVVTVQGAVYEVGDVNQAFAIESISKPFAYALALQDWGAQYVSQHVGLNATGMPFNSIQALQQQPQHLQNPLVNAGAIQITSMIKGKDQADKWHRLLNFMNRLSGSSLAVNEVLFRSEMASNQRNEEISALLQQYHMLNSEPRDAVKRYTKACSVMVTARQLAYMGATLANGGVSPLTHETLIAPSHVQAMLSQMVTNGLYENSGAWFWLVGLPAKSGVGGAILAVVPGEMAIVAFSPPLDSMGNSVRAQRVIEDLAKQWRLHLLAPKDAYTAPPSPGHLTTVQCQKHDELH